ncbi:hypothetical protein HDU96_010434 [Phlyctochytrium bullatum]|nr:hypothetical protein HDU96_010434 [Phlyctochytrium bullatum]
MNTALSHFRFHNQKEIEAEAKKLQSATARYEKQTKQWLALINQFNSTLKELGDAENWGKAIDSDIRQIAKVIAKWRTYSFEGRNGAMSSHAIQHRNSVRSTTSDRDTPTSRASGRHSPTYTAGDHQSGPGAPPSPPLYASSSTAEHPQSSLPSHPGLSDNPDLVDMYGASSSLRVGQSRASTSASTGSRMGRQLANVMSFGDAGEDEDFRKASDFAGDYDEVERLQSGRGSEDPFAVVPVVETQVRIVLAVMAARRWRFQHPHIGFLYLIIACLAATVVALIARGPATASSPVAVEGITTSALNGNPLAITAVPPAPPSPSLCHCPEPVAISPPSASNSKSKPKQPKEPIDPLEYWTLMALVVFLVLLGGIFAGLTIGLMSIDETNLSILMKSGTPTEKMHAERIAPIRKHAHLLLVTLLLANTVVNETLPVLLGILDLEGYQAVIFSTALIVVFGEIIPQAVCARYGLQVGSYLAWLVRILIYSLYIIAYPIALLLDYVLGHKGAIVYRRAQLKEFVAMHGEDHHGPLTVEEVTILRAVLELRDKTVVNIMTHLEDVMMLPLSAKLDRPTMHQLLQAGHSRVPVFNQYRDNVIGVVLVKQLVLLDPDDATPLADVPIGRLPRIRSDTPLFEILHVFEEGGSHMAVVVEEIPIEENAINSFITSSPLWVSNSPVLNARRFRTLGIVTLEDVIEEMIGQEIVDETDVYVDVGAKVKVARAFHEMERRLAKAGLGKGNSVPPSPFVGGMDEGAVIVPTSPPPLPRENTPLLHSAYTPNMGSTSYGGIPQSPAIAPTPSPAVGTGASPSLDPITPRMRPARRRKDPLVPAALLVEEATWTKPPADLCGLRIHGAGVDDEKANAPAAKEGKKSNTAADASVRKPAGSAPVDFIPIERDEDGIVVDGQYVPNELDLDNSSHRSSGSHKEVVIDVEVSHKQGSLEKLD